MTQEIIIIWLPKSMQAIKVKDILSQKLETTSSDFQLITLKNKDDKKKLKKKLKKKF